MMMLMTVERGGGCAQKDDTGLEKKKPYFEFAIKVICGKTIVSCLLACYFFYFLLFCIDDPV